MDFILSQTFMDHAHLLFLIAAITLIIELTIVGLSGPLLFFSIACAITGFLVLFNVLTGLEAEILSVGVFSLLSALLLWKPLKRFQGTGKVEDNSSDLIGTQVIASEAITQLSGTIRYSGINWTARLAPSITTKINVGEAVIIIGTNGNILIVKSVQDNQNENEDSL